VTSHECPAPGCRQPVTPDRLMCPADWREVPKPLQGAVWAAWRNGAGAGTAAHKAACKAAVRSVTNQEA
jgi:hypothetical protein